MKSLCHSNMANYLIIALGGALGSVLRYLLGNRIEPSESFFPINILLINITGCFLMGMVLALVDAKSQLFLFLTIGILGSFTTMSAFSAQALHLLLDEKYLLATSYVFLTLLSCIISTVIAYYLFKALA